MLNIYLGRKGKECWKEEKSYKSSRSAMKKNKETEKIPTTTTTRAVR